MAETATAKKQHYYTGVGRRKRAIATVRLTNGKGVITVNEKTAEQYFGNQNLAARLIRPLELVGKTNAVDLNLKAHGGGLQAQADACVLAISRALQELSPDFRPNLRKTGFLTRDSREKERKKYGLKKARKAPQFSKR